MFLSCASQCERRQQEGLSDDNVCNSLWGSFLFCFVLRSWAPRRPPAPPWLADPLTTICATLSGALFSCFRFLLIVFVSDVGVMSAAILDIEEDMDLSPVQAEVLVGSLNVIAAFGGLIAGAVVRRLYTLYTLSPE